MKPRPDLLPPDAPSGVAILQMTEGPLPWAHVYMEAQVFTPDSKRLVLHRAALSHGTDRDNPDHAYFLCDLENNGAMTPLTDEHRATAPSISPDGRYLYYFHDQTVLNGGRLALKRLELATNERETLVVIDGPIPGTSYRPSQPYPLSTISPDGARVAISAFLGDGSGGNSPWGLLVFDVAKGAVELILEGPTWLNMHPQYCRSIDHAHDILIQENHGGLCDRQGNCTKLVSGAGADIHVVRDDGAAFRSLPWGRDGTESCQGHQCWRGRSASAITSTCLRDSGLCELVESEAVPFADHIGLNSPGGRRNVLSRAFPEEPRFWHFATDIDGRHFVSDYTHDWQHYRIYAARFSEQAADPLQDWQLLAAFASPEKGKNSHPHPFLSPDGKRAFFNSDESGVLHPYMITGINR